MDASRLDNFPTPADASTGGGSPTLCTSSKSIGTFGTKTIYFSSVARHGEAFGFRSDAEYPTDEYGTQKRSTMEGPSGQQATRCSGVSRTRGFGLRADVP